MRAPRVLVVLVAGTIAAAATSCRAAEPAAQSPPVAQAPLWRVFPAPGSREVSAATSAALQAVLDEVVRLDRRFPNSTAGAAGISAAVLTPRGAWTGSAGVDAAGLPLRPASVLGIGDVTKTFTAAQVLRLVESGRLDLDAPLSRYVDHPLTARGGTVRQFLGMASGLGDVSAADVGALAERLLREAGRICTPGDLLEAYTGPLGRPGEGPTESTLDYVLLGRAVERVTGESLAAAIRADLIAPADLPHVRLWDEPVPAGPDERRRACLAAVEAGAGGAAADAAGLARWGYQLYGGRLLPQDLTAQLVTPVSRGRVDGRRYGLGTMLFSQTLGFGEAYGHEGAQVGAQSLLAVIPGRQVAIAVLLADEGKLPAAAVQELTRVIAARGCPRPLARAPHEGDERD